MLTPLDKDIIRRLQEDMPITPRPFKAMADELGIGEKELLDKVEDFREKGILRRFGAVLHHLNAGFEANAMVVWKVPEDRIHEVGAAMAGFSAVSHCYQRPVFPGWPYNLFTMVHAKNREECEEAIGLIAGTVAIKEYEILYSTREVKKSRMQYFSVV